MRHETPDSFGAPTVTLSLPERFAATETSMAEVNIERAYPIRTALLALVARQHCFYYGPPGVAKSHLVRTLHAHIEGMSRSDWFERLLTPFMTDADLFGGIDMAALDRSVHRRRTDNTLATARIAFLDEIFKASGPLLNTLLKAINEREFDNDVVEQLPLWSLFCASNEFAQEAGLAALADRLAFWHVIRPISDSTNFVRMLQLDNAAPIQPTLSVADIEAAQAEASSIEVDRDVYAAIDALRHDLRNEGIEHSDRRFKSLIPVIRATAWMRRSPTASVDDMAYTRFMLWRRPEEIPTVDTLVLQLASPLEAEAVRLGNERIEPLVVEVTKLLDNRNELTLPQRQRQSINLHRQLAAAAEDVTSLANRLTSRGGQSARIHELRQSLKTITDRLLQEMFEIQRESP